MEKMLNSRTDELHASKLARDPRVAKAKELIAEAVGDHQKKIESISPPTPSLKASYDSLLRSFGETRGGNLWYPYLGSGIGNGPLVELLDGSVKYDFISGIGVHYWGHSHHDIIDTTIDAAISNTVAQGHLQQNADSVSLSELLIKSSGMDHCFLTTSGAMANENALKILFQNRYPASRILAFEHGFAGRTLAVASITDKAKYRLGLPTCLNVDYVPFFDYERPEESIREALRVLKMHLHRYPDQHAAMMFELVQGEGGFYSGSTEFFTVLMKELKSHGIKIFVDEIQTFGRLPKLFAFQHFQLEEYVDVVSIGKLSQACATLYKKELQPQPGLLSQTFTGSTSMIRAGHVIISSLIKDGYFGAEGKIQSIHDHFVQGLKGIEQRHPDKISGPWGIGAMIAFTPFGGEADKVLKLSHDLYDAGVICFVTGGDPMRIRFLIPMGVIEKKHIDDVLKIIEATLTA